MIPAPAAHCETQVTPKVDLTGLRDISLDERDSVSDASSIPLDSVRSENFTLSIKVDF